MSIIVLYWIHCLNLSLLSVNKTERYFFPFFNYIIIMAYDKQTYTFDEAFNASVDYFGGDELAANVWVNKYAVKDSFGNIFEKTRDDMHWRIANEVARV